MLVQKGRRRYRYSLPTKELVEEGLAIRRDRKNRNHPTSHLAFLRPVEDPSKYSYLSEIVAPRPWADRPAFIIGGGESLNQADLSTLTGQLTIGTNRSIEIFDSSFLFSVDTRFLRWLIDKTLPDTAKAYKTSLATKVWLQVLDEWEFSKENIHLVPRNPATLWSESLADGIPGYATNNSGLAAMSLATIFGANPIYLLGMDMVDPPPGKQGAWWHSGYPIKQSRTVYSRRMAPRWDQAAGVYKEHPVEIYNLNPKSAITGFKKLDYTFLKGLRMPQNPRVVGFYTMNSPYGPEALRMAHSAHRFGLRAHLEEVPNQGSWSANTSYKPSFLLDMLNKFSGEPLLYLDADARIVRYPKGLDSPPEGKEIGVHYRKDVELLSGTVWLSGSPACRELVREWARNCQEDKRWDQKVLQDVLKEKQDAVWRLPPEFTCIFDLMKDDTDAPVILHYQASRKFRDVS